MWLVTIPLFISGKFDIRLLYHSDPRYPQKEKETGHRRGRQFGPCVSFCLISHVLCHPPKQVSVKGYFSLGTVIFAIPFINARDLNAFVGKSPNRVLCEQNRLPPAVFPTWRWRDAGFSHSASNNPSVVRPDLRFPVSPSIKFDANCKFPTSNQDDL